MKEYYEIKYRGRVRTFNNEDEALRRATSLKKLGYEICLYYVSESLYSELRVRLR